MNTSNASNDVPLQILIAEDSPTQAARLVYILEQNGYQVRLATNGRLALEAARANRPNLIISDIIMPEMNGYELCREVKSDSSLRTVPVILVTTLSDPQDVIRGLECHADNFIIKPYNERYLLSRIQFVLLNCEMHEREQSGMGIEVYFNGQRHFITADRLQILNLLLSTYEAAMQRNQELTRAREELRVANDSLEAANGELEAFSYSVSHDLRAPLRSINGFSRILLEDHGDQLNEEGTGLLVRLQSSCVRMEQLIADLLSLSRITRDDMVREQVDLSSIAKSILDELQRNNPERVVEAVVEPGLMAEGDGRLLRIALENLLGNAWKFTSKKPGARIEFGARPDDAGIFHVRDNGAGFDEQYAEKLFGTFQRLHSVEQFEGTGIGLATVRRIIHRHGGKIWAEGKVDQGATFYFALYGD